MAASSSKLTQNDYIDLVGGKFKLTNLSELKGAFHAFEASKTNHLASFFHGGLVSRGDAMATAELLIDGYRNAGAYPFFFIWNSDLLTKLKAKLAPFAEDVVTRRVVEQHILFVSRQMLALRGLSATEQQALSDIAQRPRGEPPPSLTTLADFGRTFDRIWGQRRGVVTLPPVEEWNRAIQTFEEDLATDPSVQGRWLNQDQRFTALLGRGIFTRLWERTRLGRDHGLYTTLIEEIAIAIGLHTALTAIWEGMKDDIDAAFRSDATMYGGTAFLDCLQLAWQAHSRLTLIAHSGGAVYINRLLNAIDRRLLPAVKADIVFVAAALSFDALAATINATVFERRVRNFRFFALKDECEGGYWEVPLVYDKSLLYLLSALCERDFYADKPLIGMQRYWSGTRPYNSPAIRTVIGRIVPGERVWSPTDDSAAPGYRARAHRHGGFHTEDETNRSVEYFLH